jgi:diguanylate cyclase (GGDEF)-like protein
MGRPVGRACGAAFQCILALVTCLSLTSPVAAAAPQVRALESVADATVSDVINGSLDSRFTAGNLSDHVARGDFFWLKVDTDQPARAETVPVLVVHAGMTHRIHFYLAGSGDGKPLPEAAHYPEFAGTRDTAFVVRPGRSTLYVHVEPPGPGHTVPRVMSSDLRAFLGRGAASARIITLVFGALAAMAVASLLIWIVLRERAFILYFALFCLQALYVAYFSGQGFEWPWLSHAAPMTHYTWNIVSALSGAAACLFVREIADLKRFLPRNYVVFGWLASAFVLLTIANLLKLLGYEDAVNNAGNALFLGAAIYTIIVAFVAWRRGSRAAGWFLLAWIMLEAFTIAATVRLLLSSNDQHERVVYYGMPLSMVAAALLIALGIADRLRDQRRALSEAERHARFDSLTGVLNRRSLVERLEAACLRARARGLPISLLFIDLDHFKDINDTFGHAAGDACLRAIIPPIQAELRQSDVIGRYGGEEFVVILSSADAAAAHPIAQRILERVAGVRVDGFGEPIALTCSIGVATSDMLGVWGEHLIAQADAAVYAAKRSGRNRVQLAMPMAA